MSLQHMQDNLPWLMLHASRTARHAISKCAEAYDLTLMQTFILCLLDREEAVPMNSISGLIGCDASNVTGIVDRLVGNGYIERKEYDKDRRIKVIKLTPKGGAIRDELLKKTAETPVGSLAVLSAEEQATLKQLLVKVLAAGG